MIIPAAYLIAGYSNEESMFVGFKFGTDNDRGLIGYGNWRVFLRCGFSTRSIAKIRPLDLMHLRSKEDVNTMLQRVGLTEAELGRSE